MATPLSPLGLSRALPLVSFSHFHSINTLKPIKNINESFFLPHTMPISKCALTHSKYPRKEKIEEMYFYIIHVVWCEKWFSFYRVRFCFVLLVNDDCVCKCESTWNLVVHYTRRFLMLVSFPPNIHGFGLEQKKEAMNWTNKSRYSNPSSLLYKKKTKCPKCCLIHFYYQSIKYQTQFDHHYTEPECSGNLQLCSAILLCVSERVLTYTWSSHRTFWCQYLVVVVS